MTHSKVSGWLCGNNAETKAVRRRRLLEVYNSILRDKTRGECGIAYWSIARESETSCDRCYCEPYVHISKCPAGTYTLHIYIYIRTRVVFVATNLEKLTDVQSQISVALDQAACRR